MAKRCSQTRPARTKGADDAKRVAVQLYNGVPMRDTHQQHLDERDAPCVESVQPVTVARRVGKAGALQGLGGGQVAQ